MNDTTIIKAELCDFLSARTKNLANIYKKEKQKNESILIILTRL